MPVVRIPVNVETSFAYFLEKNWGELLGSTGLNAAKQGYTVNGL
jgi:hypothetical protein